jgi:hypothetical protein
MVEIVLWTTPNLPFDKAGSTLYENPKNGFMHNFNVTIKNTSLTDPNFLLDYEWDIIGAKVRPQCHIVLVDGRDLVKLPSELIQRVCACVIDFTVSHPMKYVIFYDILSFTNPDESAHSTVLYEFIEAQSYGLASYAKPHRHLGAPFDTTLTPNGNLDSFSMKVLARSILIQVHEIFDSNE